MSRHEVIQRSSIQADVQVAEAESLLQRLQPYDPSYMKLQVPSIPRPLQAESEWSIWIWKTHNDQRKMRCPKSQQDCKAGPI